MRQVPSSGLLLVTEFFFADGGLASGLALLAAWTSSELFVSRFPPGCVGVAEDLSFVGQLLPLWHPLAQAHFGLRKAVRICKNPLQGL